MELLILAGRACTVTAALTVLARVYHSNESANSAVESGALDV
jgi:hypothetical protein